LYRRDRNPGAFMSYAHIDDDDGRLSEFREKLSAQTQKLIGEKFPIFQDHEDIKWGQEWEARIDESLAEVTFFITIITPSFFRSKYCRDELTRFLEREERLGLKLILPAYYIDTPLIKDESRRSTDELAQKISSRQCADCRDLFIEDLDSPKIRKLMFNLGTQIRDALEGLPPEPTDITVTASPEMKTAEQISNSSRPKTHHRDIVVDPMCRGDYTTIYKAIEAANPGDKILVRPGLYQEGLIIDKPLEIVGEGERDEIEVQAMGKSALVFKTSNGQVANLTLRQMGGEGVLYGVDIAQGRLKLEDCDISSQSSACVAIHDGAHPRLLRNKIHDGNKSGVYVFDNGQGIIEENELFENTYAGVSIETGGNPILRKNQIHDGKSIGVRVYNNGQGVLEDNDIFANADAQVDIREGGNPTLRRNTIRDGKQSGVHVYKNGQGVLEDNDVFGNAKYGVAIETGGNPTLRRNKIHDGKNIGVDISWNGLGVLEDNDIFGNASRGVWIYGGCNPILRGNRINRNGSNAICITNSGGTIEDNDLRDNAYSALVISDESKSKVKLARNLKWTPNK